MSAWNSFFEEKAKVMIREKSSFLDIGGGLRLTGKGGNRAGRGKAWIQELLKGKTYHVMDPVVTYAPDIVGDIHRMPFADGSQEAIFCLSVLEHVEQPFTAAAELHRVLERGGYCLVYVPFLYYFHAERGYYKDYWRFTEDALRVLFAPFSSVEIQQVRGAIETWVHLSLFGRVGIFAHLARGLDRLTGKSTSKQTSGYYVFLTK